MVHDGVDERENFEEGIVDTIDEGSIYVHKSNGGVFDGDFNRFDQRVDQNTGGVEPLFIDFRLRAEPGVASQFA